MIIDHPLSAKDRRISQKRILIFNSINGLSYMCLGETLLILLAVKIMMPDTLITILGAMQYIGFILLPLGVWRAGSVGAAQCQADFWVARNTAALFAAVGAIVSLKFPILGWSILLLASFTFYGCRAAGVVLAQPLTGEITTTEDRPQFIAKCGALFYLFGVIALILVSLTLQIKDSLYVLCGVIVIGASLGVTASSLLRAVRETATLKNSACRKLLPELKTSLKNPFIIQQLFAGFWATIAIVTILPVSVLFIKKGYGFTNTQALFFSSTQFIACFVVSYFTGKFAAKKGPRLLLLVGYITYLILVLLWILAPFTGMIWIIPLSLIAFALYGSAVVMGDNALQGYFLMTIPKEQQVITAVLINILRGFCAGLGGMLLASGLLKLAQYLIRYINPYILKFFPDAVEQISIYKLYFVMLLPCLLIGFRQICKLKTVITTFKEKYGNEAVKEAVLPQRKN